MDRPPRYFTLEEANRLLPRVRSLLETLRTQADDLAAIQRRLQDGGRALGPASGRRGAAAPSTNGQGPDGAAGRYFDALQRADTLLEAIRGVLEQLEAIGCEVKDVRSGLVDFRTVREGRPVYLCWRLGEDSIRYWHELDTGFAGRQPLDEC
jgi:hypothetical protein